MVERIEGLRLKSEQILEAIHCIKTATSIESLLGEAIECTEVKTLMYHVVTEFGAYDSGQANKPFNYNFPLNSDIDLNEPNITQNVLGLLNCISAGDTVWLSDMIDHDAVKKSPHILALKRYLALNGDGLLLSLFGPKGQKAHAFVSFGRHKDAFAPLFEWQVHALLQMLHVRHCQMSFDFQKKVKLTKREKEVLELITLGKTNPEIATILNITKNTVGSYVKLIFVKLETSDRVTAAMRARTLHLVA